MARTEVYKVYLTDSEYGADTIIRAGLESLYGRDFEDKGVSYETDYEDVYDE